MTPGPNRKTESEQLVRYLTRAGARKSVVTAMRKLLHNQEAFSRLKCTPGHFTASAFVVNPARTHVLLIHHRKLGRWLQPGGHVESQDISLRAAAHREASEETGIAGLTPLALGVFDVDIHDIPARPEQAAHRHFDVRFAFVATRVALRASEEVRAARWVAFAEVGDWNPEVSVMRPVAALRRLCSKPLGAGG